MESGIEDSRHFYYRPAGFLRFRSVLTGGLDHWLLRHAEELKRRSEERGRLVVIDVGLGILGTRVGDRVHILDPVALAEPLLARLPARRDVPWRMGHFRRVIPEGLVDTLDSGTNQLFDRDLAEYYDKLSMLVHG